jgi:hypothetical protein
MMALSDEEELKERRASLLIYPGFSPAHPRKRGGRGGRCLRRQVGEKDKTDNPLCKPLDNPVLLQSQGIWGARDYTVRVFYSEFEFTLRACKQNTQIRKLDCIVLHCG